MTKRLEWGRVAAWQFWRGLLPVRLWQGSSEIRHLAGTGSLSPKLIAIAIALAVTNGMIGFLFSVGVGLDPGSAAALAILAGSASYIAAPAAIRMALPEIDAGMPLTMSLAVTFPFNVLVAIPVLTVVAGVLT